MAQQYETNMRGTISRNDRKEKDSHPDIKGDCEIDGVAYWIDGWRKDRKDGSGSFYSLSFKAKEGQSGARKPAKQASSADEDIPFADPYKGRRSYVE